MGRSHTEGERTRAGSPYLGRASPTKAACPSGSARVRTPPGPRLVAPVGAWSAEKLDLLRCYLGREGGRGGFLPATRGAHRRYYIDLFAGPCQNFVRGSGQVIDGSPVVALKGGPPFFTQLHLVDKDPRNVASLESHRLDYPDRQITTYAGDANVWIDDILARVPREYPVFAFLDPRGAELHWQTIVKLARHKPARKIELFILFAFNMGLVRLLPRDPDRLTNEAVLDRTLPDPASWRRIYHRRAQLSSAEFRRAILDEYTGGLRALGYQHVPSPRLITTPKRRGLYFPLFASDHQAGDRIMSHCLQTVRETSLQGSYLPYDQRY
ncbi:MAG TPA: three-Cys-motif partner protein TcmP [Dehalococcoidia bacterium]|nr:three-Cys-motif partner protein TcmP [Dehalococcoidia bacterium]